MLWFYIRLIRLHLKLLCVLCIYICKWSYKGDPDDRAFRQDVFCGDTWMLFSGIDELLFTRGAYWFREHFYFDLDPVLILERLLPCWWMMFYKYLWFECRAATIPWRVRGSSPLGHKWDTSEEWQSSEDKRLYLLLTYADPVWAVMSLLLNSREKFFTLVFLVLRFAFLLGREEGVELEKKKPVWGIFYSNYTVIYLREHCFFALLSWKVVFFPLSLP